MKFGFFKGLKLFSLFITVCAAAYIVRELVYSKEKHRVERDYRRGFPEKVDFVPFTVESAMMYSYAAEVAETGHLSETDPLLRGMENEPIAERFTNGLEYFLGYGYRIRNSVLGKKPPPPSDFEDNPDFTSFARVQLRLWISLVSGFVFLWLVVMRLPYRWALVGGLLHAFSPAAIARYTGQDIVRGDFALTFIVAAFLVAAWHLREPSYRKLALLAAVAFAALVFWDMTQICFAIWGVCELVRVASGGGVNRKRKTLWLALATAVVLASLASTYHRAHWLILSPLMVFVLPAIFISHACAAKFTGRKRPALVAVSAAAFCLVWLLVAKFGPAAGTYSHFASLMKEKLIHLNIKPANPAELDFDARSVWVPDMHSTDRGILKAFFPMASGLAAALLLATFLVPATRRSFKRWAGLLHFPLFMSCFYFAGFILLVRYHVFAILFISMLLPLLFRLWTRNAGKLDRKDALTALGALFAWFAASNAYMLSASTPVALLKAAALPALALAAGVLAAWGLSALAGLVVEHRGTPLRRPAKAFLAILAAFLLAAELDGPLSSSRVYDQHYFAETAALIKWMRAANVKGETFVSGFELSPMLKAYCGAKIVMQPKFETVDARKRFKDYINIMFHGTEKDLLDFCVDNAAEYFVFDKGMASATDWYSPRYLADALRPLDPKCPAAMMSTPFGKGNLKHFYEIRPPWNIAVLSNRYSVFKVVSAEDSANAIVWALDAERAWRHGDKFSAARLAKAAVYADPMCAKADIMYRKTHNGENPEIRLRGY